MKLSREESRLHHSAVSRLVSGRDLSMEDRDFIARNFHEGATSDNVQLSAFFTPEDLADHLALNVPGHARVLDLCGGIGALSKALGEGYHPAREIVLVEINEEYCEAARKILPGVEVICGSMYDEVLMAELKSRDFDVAVSNPPFGRITKPKAARSPRFNGEAHYEAIDIASDLAKTGVFILPQQACPFRYSGHQSYKRVENQRYEAFRKATGIELDIGLSIDTSVLCSFRGTKITVEIVEADFIEARKRRLPAEADLFGLAA